MRRSDVYETRARELAELAGHDADARVAGPGGKMMPAWCTFRDAARAEHLAAEAASLGLPPQAPAFQNAPLQVFGRGPEYLRIIYGPDYTMPQNLDRLRER
jgi:tRNA-splicing ligase RtcB